MLRKKINLAWVAVALRAVADAIEALPAIKKAGRFSRRKVKSVVVRDGQQ